MDISRTSTGQRIAGIGGVLLFIFLFLPWFGEGNFELSGWEGQSSTDIYMLIVAIVAVAAALAGPNELVPGVTLNGAAALLGGVATIQLIWLSFFDGDGREYGMYLSLLAAIAIAVGGYMAATEGTAPRAAGRDRL
jgi:hypothetical protein